MLLLLFSETDSVSIGYWYWFSYLSWGIFVSNVVYLCFYGLFSLFPFIAYNRISPLLIHPSFWRKILYLKLSSLHSHRFLHAHPNLQLPSIFPFLINRVRHQFSFLLCIFTSIASLLWVVSFFQLLLYIFDSYFIVDWTIQ